MYNDNNQGEKLPIPGLVESELYQLKKASDRSVELEKIDSQPADLLERFSPSCEKIEEENISR